MCKGKGEAWGIQEIAGSSKGWGIGPALERQPGWRDWQELETKGLEGPACHLKDFALYCDRKSKHLEDVITL